MLREKLQLKACYQVAPRDFSPRAATSNANKKGVFNGFSRIAEKLVVTGPGAAGSGPQVVSEAFVDVQSQFEYITQYMQI